MSAIRYSERRFWSVTLGCRAARISVPDAHNDEHYAVVAMDGTGRENRERRTFVLNRLAEHAASQPPGEVEV